MVEELSVREAAGIFETAESFKSAIEDLLSSGFDHAEISLLGSQSAVEQKLGYRYETTSELVEMEGLPRISRLPESAVGNAQGLLIGGLVYVGALAVAGPILIAGGSLAVARRRPGRRRCGRSGRRFLRQTGRRQAWPAHRRTIGAWRADPMREPAR
jgi:hypothetical protein